MYTQQFKGPFNHISDDTLRISEKFYGREEEILQLKSAWQRVYLNGSSEFCLLRGESGMGKQTIIKEFYQSLKKQKGEIFFGKFSSSQTDHPYHGIINAFRNYENSNFSTENFQVKQWKETWGETLEKPEEIIAKLIPQWEESLSPWVTGKKFSDTYLQSPIILVLEDLQWADKASLQWIEHLFEKQIPNFFLIGTVQGKTTGVDSFLGKRLSKIRENIRELNLYPLQVSHVNELIQDTFHASQTESYSLANLIHKETGGNPFDVKFLLQSFFKQGLVHRDQRSAWKWDLDVIDLLEEEGSAPEKIRQQVTRLSLGALDVIRVAACIGNKFDLETLSTGYNETEERILQDLSESIEAGLIQKAGEKYYFTHNRIHQVIYSQIPETSRENIHIQLGCLISLKLEQEGNYRKYWS